MSSRWAIAIATAPQPNRIWKDGALIWETGDSLPLIGPVPGARGIYAAYGYGGNGITSSFLAAQLIGDLIAGSRSPLLDDFALDRDVHAAVA